MEKPVTGRCDYVAIRKCGQGGDGILLYRVVGYVPWDEYHTTEKKEETDLNGQMPGKKGGCVCVRRNLMRP